MLPDGCVPDGGFECQESCPSYDGKRCELTGNGAPAYRHGGICPIWAACAAEALDLPVGPEDEEGEDD